MLCPGLFLPSPHRTPGSGLRSANPSGAVPPPHASTTLPSCPGFPKQRRDADVLAPGVPWMPAQSLLPCHGELGWDGAGLLLPREGKSWGCDQKPAGIHLCNAHRGWINPSGKCKCSMHQTVTGMRGENPHTTEFWFSTSATTRTRSLLPTGMVLVCPPCQGHPSVPTAPSQPLQHPQLSPCSPCVPLGCWDVAPKGTGEISRASSGFSALLPGQ